MARPQFAHDDFLDAALKLAARHGPQSVSVAAITGALNAPTGSFYHRFKSRDVLLGELWLRTVLDFEQGIEVALSAGDGLAAALHTPAWVRGNLPAACLLLLYHRDDFVHGEWPESLQAQIAAHTTRSRVRLQRFVRNTFGHAGQEAIRRAQFAIAEAPVAAVRQHLHRREKPPSIVDELIRATYQAVMPQSKQR